MAMLETLDRSERLRLMKFVCSFAWADLEVRPEERAFVANLVKRLSLAPDEAEQVSVWLQLPPRPETIDPSEIPTEHRWLFLEEIRGVIESDGIVAVDERENLRLLEQLLP
jgi:hypothetical protein